MTPRRKRFVDEYLIDLNATQAAIRAGYSARTANEQGARLLANVSVAAAIRAAQAERSERTKVDADWLLSRLAEEATADVADLYDDNGNLKPVSEWPLIWRQGLVGGLETVRERVGKDEEGRPEYSTIHKVKLSDRAKRLEMIGRHIGVQAFKDNVKVEGLEGIAKAIEKARQRASV